MVQTKAISPQRLVRQWVFTALTAAVGISGLVTAAFGAHLHVNHMWTHQVNCPGHLWLTSSLQIVYSIACLLARVAKMISPKWYFPAGAVLLIVQIIGITDVAIARSYLNRIHPSSSADSGPPLSMVYMIRDEIERDCRIGSCSVKNESVVCLHPRVNARLRPLQTLEPLDGICMAEELRRKSSTEEAALFCRLFKGVLHTWQSTLTTALIILIATLIVSAAQTFTSALIILF